MAQERPASGPASFVIRLWLEPGQGPGRPEWRWHAHHVQSGRERYFRTLEELLRFVARCAAAPPPA